MNEIERLQGLLKEAKARIEELEKLNFELQRFDLGKIHWELVVTRQELAASNEARDRMETLCGELREHLTRCMFKHEMPERASEPRWSRIADLIQGHRSPPDTQPAPPDIKGESVPTIKQSLTVQPVALVEQLVEAFADTQRYMRQSGCCNDELWDVVEKANDAYQSYKSGAPSKENK